MFKHDYGPDYLGQPKAIRPDDTEETVAEYTKGLLATRGLGYHGGSLKDRDSVNADNEIIPADLDPVSISVIVRNAHEHNGGKLGRLLPPRQL